MLLYWYLLLSAQQWTSYISVNELPQTAIFALQIPNNTSLTFVHGPHNNEAMLVTGGELAVLLIPLDHLNRAIVGWEALVHCQVAGRCQATPFRVCSCTAWEVPTHVRGVVDHCTGSNTSYNNTYSNTKRNLKRINLHYGQSKIA